MSPSNVVIENHYYVHLFLYYDSLTYIMLCHFYTYIILFIRDMSLGLFHSIIPTILSCFCCNIDIGFFFKMAASHSTMFDILVKVGLGEHYGVFLEQKITPDIVCCLAAIEMQ